jgi:hypothetical protein
MSIDEGLFGWAQEARLRASVKKKPRKPREIGSG